MSSRFIERCLDRILPIFLTIHLLAWVATAFVWAQAWSEDAAPTGPRFNFAKEFIARIDIAVYLNAASLSQGLAQKLSPIATLNMNLCYVVLLAGFLLLLGSLQWLLAARFVEWVRVKSGTKVAATLALGLILWALGATGVWVLG